MPDGKIRSLVGLDQSICRARHFLNVRYERPDQPSRKCRLPDTQSAMQGNHVARLQQGGDRIAECERVSLIVESVGQFHHHVHIKD